MCDSSVVWLSWSWSCVLYVLVPDWSSRFVLGLLLLVLCWSSESFPGSLSRRRFLSSLFVFLLLCPFRLYKKSETPPSYLSCCVTRGPGGEGNTISFTLAPNVRSTQGTTSAAHDPGIVLFSPWLQFVLAVSKYILFLVVQLTSPRLLLRPWRWKGVRQPGLQAPYPVSRSRNGMSLLY